MARLFQLVIVAAFATLLPVASHACEFLAAEKDSSGIPTTFDTVADGVVSGFLRCGREAFPAYVWTLGVDGDPIGLNRVAVQIHLPHSPAAALREGTPRDARDALAWQVEGLGAV